MDTYCVRGATRKTTGHYRRPGTRTLYCGRPAGIKNTDGATLRGWKMCAVCVKAEAADRAAAEETAAQHRTTPDPLAEWRATLTYGARVYDPVRRQAGTVINPRKRIRLPHGGTVRGALVEFPHGYVARVPLSELHPVPDATADTERAAAEEQPAESVRCTVHGDACDHDPKRRHIFRPVPDAEQGALFA